MKRVNFQSSSILNCGASRFASVSNHLLLCIKGFITPRGEQTLSHIPEKLLITRAIYQLSFNKYNKACLNTNLTKTPYLFMVEFQELLWISVRETCRFMFTRIFYLHLHSYSSLVKTWFSTHKQDFSALSFPRPTLSTVECSWLENRLAMTKRACIWWHEIEAKKVIYIHTYIHAYKRTCIQNSQMGLALGTDNTGFSCMRPELVEASQQ